jgi:hypothetical protein
MYKQMLHGLLPVVGFCLILIIFSHFALSVAFCELNNQLVITRPIRLAVILLIMSALTFITAVNIQYFSSIPVLHYLRAVLFLKI